MGTTHATPNVSRPPPAYHSHAKTISCVDDWRKGFALDLERFFLPVTHHSAAQFLPRELYRIIAAYAIPNFSDIISCHGWIGAGLFGTIPARVESRHDADGYARLRYEFSWAVTRAGDLAHETPEFLSRELDGFTLRDEIRPLIQQQFQYTKVRPKRDELAARSGAVMSALLQLMAGWTDENGLRIGWAAPIRTDPLWAVIDQNVAIRCNGRQVADSVRRRGQPLPRTPVVSITNGGVHESTFTAVRTTYLIASRDDTDWTHVLRLRLRFIDFPKSRPTNE